MIDIEIVVNLQVCGSPNKTGKLVEVVKKTREERQRAIPPYNLSWGRTNPFLGSLTQLPHALSSPQSHTLPDRYLSQLRQEIPGLRTVQLSKGSLLIVTRTKNLMVLGTAIQWKGYISAQQKRSSLFLFQPAPPSNSPSGRSRKHPFYAWQSLKFGIGVSHEPFCLVIPLNRIG